MTRSLWLLWLVLALVVLTSAYRPSPPSPAVPSLRALILLPDTTERKRVLITADLLERLVENGDTIRRLTGSVRGRQDSTDLFSDRAVEFEARRTFLLTGNVLIVDAGDSLRADTVLYDEQTKVGRARGRVRLSDGEVLVTAPSGVYYVDDKRARFEETVTIRDSTATLTSLRGIYWSDDKRAELDGDVRLRSDRAYLEADSLTYYRETEISIARGRVFVDRWGGAEAPADSTVHTLLFSDYAYTDERNGRSRMEGEPLLVRIRHDTADADPDTLVVRARRLESVEQDSLQRLIAVADVQVWQRDFAAVADSVRSERRTAAVDTLDEIRLFRQPMVWVGDSQISGDSLRLKRRSGTADTLFVWQNAFVARRDSVLDRIHQVSGRHLVGVFEEDSTRTFTVGPNAEVLYFRKDDQERLDGVLQISGDRAVFRFYGEDPRDIVFPGEYQGTYHPPDQLPEPLQLEGFRWEPDRRPSKDALLADPRVADWMPAEAPAVEDP